MDNFLVICAEQNDFIIKVVDLNSFLRLLGFDLNYIIFVKFNDLFITFESEIIFIIGLKLVVAFQLMLLALILLCIKHDQTEGSAINRKLLQSVCCKIGTDWPWFILNGASFVDAFIEKNSVGRHNVHGVLPLSVCNILIFEDEKVNHIFELSKMCKWSCFISKSILWHEFESLIIVAIKQFVH